LAAGNNNEKKRVNKERTNAQYFLTPGRG